MAVTKQHDLEETLVGHPTHGCPNRSQGKGGRTLDLVVIYQRDDPLGGTATFTLSRGRSFPTRLGG